MIDPTVVARDLYDLDGSATPLPGEHDHNFRLDVNGARFVLKVHRPGADLSLEDAVLEHLRDEPAVPQLAGPTGRSGDRVVRLLTWLEGHPWADAPGDLASLGRTVARVDRALAGFEHAGMRRHHPWDLRNAPDLGIEVPALDHLPHQVIHNDANEHNVLVADDGAVTGLIDFGDVVWTARVCGLAVAGAYAMQGRPDPARAVVPVVRGYHEITPLRPDELAVLFRADVGAAADERRDGGAAVRGGTGQRVPADQPDGREGDARAAGARGRAARPLPVPRRVRLRGEPERAPCPAVPVAASSRPGHRRRLGVGAGARPRRRDAARRRPGDRALRRAALDLHRPRVPDAGRALADATHGRRSVRAGRHAGVRAVRRRRGAA